MPNDTELADAIVQSSEGDTPDGLPAVAEPEATPPPASSEEGAAAAEESTDKGEEQVEESGTEQQAETPEQMQARLIEQEATIAARDKTIEERTGAYDSVMSELQRTQQQVQSADAVEAQHDQAEIAERNRQSGAEDDPEWLDIVANRGKLADWIGRGDALKERAQARSLRAEMFAMRAQEISDGEARRVFGVIDKLRTDAKMTDAEWDAFRAEHGEKKSLVRDSQTGRMVEVVTQPAFHYLKTNFALIEKTATDIIRGRYAPQAVAEAADNADRNATNRVQKTMMTQLPSGGGAEPTPQETDDADFERKIVEFDDTNG